MDFRNVIFEPHNDIGAEDVQLLKKYKNLLDEKKYSEATTLLNNENCNKGFRASLFNLIQNKIRTFQQYLLNEFVANKDEFYSQDEPEQEFMRKNNYKFWCKIY